LIEDQNLQEPRARQGLSSGFIRVAIENALRVNSINRAEKQIDERQRLSCDRLQSGESSSRYFPNVSLSDVKRIRLLAYRCDSFFKYLACFQAFSYGTGLSGTIEIEQNRIVVRFDKRSHNPILREALDLPNQKISWLRNLPVVFQYP
jgi:hypothetical protein